MAKTPEHTTYSDAGVDIELGDNASKILYRAARRTWDNRRDRFGEINSFVDSFTTVRGIEVGQLPEGTISGSNSDGVGTKVEIAERLGDYEGIARDLLAMVCDDAAVTGCEPVFVSTILDVNSLSFQENAIQLIQQLAQGYVIAAQEAGVAILNGELAELGNRVNGYGRFNVNWGATATWYGNKEKLLTGSKIAPGQAIVGFRENGFRSNGLSLVRKILENTYGVDWHKNGEGAKFATQVLEPSKIYTRLLTTITGGLEDVPQAHISGAAHITGGGLPGKLHRLLGINNLGANIHSPMNPAQAMLDLQNLGGVVDEEAYKTWNMGQGMVVTTENPNSILGIAEEHGIYAQIIGEVQESPEISITSRGIEQPDTILRFYTT